MTLAPNLPGLAGHTNTTDLTPELGVLLGGRWVAGSRGTFVVDDPATGPHLAEVADGGIVDARAAVDAATEAAATW